MTGIPEPSSFTVIGLGTIRFLSDLVACAVLGSLLTVAAFDNQDGNHLSRLSRRILNYVSGLALLWAILSALQICFTYSDLVPTHLSQSFNPSQLSSFVDTVPQAKALWIQCCATVALAAFAFRIRRTLTAQLAFAVAALALLPPALSGHSSEATNHELAVTSLSVHVIAATVWTGGVFALCLIAFRSPISLSLKQAAQRFSNIAFVCYFAVVISGVINAFIRVPTLDDLVSTQYGFLVVFKTTAAILLGFVGMRHRQTTLPQLENNETIAFQRYISVEVVIMAVTFAIAVTLTRSAPPG